METRPPPLRGSPPGGQIQDGITLSEAFFQDEGSLSLDFGRRDNRTLGKTSELSSRLENSLGNSSKDSTGRRITTTTTQTTTTPAGVRRTGAAAQVLKHGGSRKSKATSTTSTWALEPRQTMLGTTLPQCMSARWTCASLSRNSASALITSITQAPKSLGEIAAGGQQQSGASSARTQKEATTTASTTKP